MSRSSTKITVLFVCTHNSARSQMAEGLLKDLAGEGVHVQSAGTVASEVRAEAIAVMDEVGVDIHQQFSKSLDGFLNDRVDFVVTVCDQANDTCPVFPNAQHRWHWSIEDPSTVEGSKADKLSAFRAARDELIQRIEDDLLPVIGT